MTETKVTRNRFSGNIETLTETNTFYRRVLTTGSNMQLVLMNLAPNTEIGEETHPADQFFRIESGLGVAILGKRRRITLNPGDFLFVKAGTLHNVKAGSQGLKLYTIYAPPMHKPGTKQRETMTKKSTSRKGRIA